MIKVRVWISKEEVIVKVWKKLLRRNGTKLWHAVSAYKINGKTQMENKCEYFVQT